jgi:hypothetical protein
MKITRAKKIKNISTLNDHPKTQVRFKSHEHFTLVKQAVERSGLSMNGWFIRVTLEAARRELKHE